MSGDIKSKSNELRDLVNRVAKDFDREELPEDTKHKYRSMFERVSASLKDNTNTEILNNAGIALSFALDLSKEIKKSIITNGELLDAKIQLRESEEHANKSNKLARIDTLTEIPNRRGFEENAGKMFNRFIRGDLNDLAVLFIDVKKFKTINDTLGHSIGDDALKKIADILDDTARKEDLVARFAGDEFIIACPGKHPEILRERIYRAFDNATLYVSPNRVDPGKCSGAPPKQIPLSVDVGLAQATDKMDSLDSLVKLSDTDMYKEKTRARTRISLAQDSNTLENIPE